MHTKCVGYIIWVLSIQYAGVGVSVLTMYCKLFCVCHISTLHFSSREQGAILVTERFMLK